MDLATENKIAAMFLKEAAELRKWAEKEGVHVYLEHPKVRVRPNSRLGAARFGRKSLSWKIGLKGDQDMRSITAKECLMTTPRKMEDGGLRDEEVEEFLHSRGWGEERTGSSHLTRMCPPIAGSSAVVVPWFQGWMKQGLILLLGTDFTEGQTCPLVRMWGNTELYWVQRNLPHGSLMGFVSRSLSRPEERSHKRFIRGVLRRSMGNTRLKKSVGLREGRVGRRKGVEDGRR